MQDVAARALRRGHDEAVMDREAVPLDEIERQVMSLDIQGHHRADATRGGQDFADLDHVRLSLRRATDANSLRTWTLTTPRRARRASARFAFAWSSGNR